MPGFRVFRSAIIMLLLGVSAVVYVDGLDITQDELRYWYNVIDADGETVESHFGNSFIEISPEALGSRAERVLWYKTGLTLWFSGGRVVQLRLDSNTEGSAGGLQIGSTISQIKKLCGSPWIEDDSSLYYNLPWRSGPVRLRFVFENMELTEAYLYIVR